MKDKFKVGVSDYWLYNYHFKKKSIFLSKNIGDQFLNTIIINTLVPLLVLYADEKKADKFKQKAISLFYNLKNENNSIVDGFKKIGYKSKNSAQSQALLHLKHSYCDTKKCLSCTTLTFSSDA